MAVPLAENLAALMAVRTADQMADQKEYWWAATTVANLVEQ